MNTLEREGGERRTKLGEVYLGNDSKQDGVNSFQEKNFAGSRGMGGTKIFK